MADPIVFDHATPRFALPMLYTGQAQKEVFVNEALFRTDALLHCAVIGKRLSPPENPAEGDAWLISSPASGDWAGKADSIALCQGGAWTFIAPRDGMHVFDLSEGQNRLFFRSWRKALLIAEPVGGSTVDGEARAAIAELMASLQAVGVLPSA